MTQNLKFKIKEFEWFEMQTKVRQIIQQVLGPIQKRILQSSALINKIKTSQAEDELRIQEISMMIANDPKVFQTGVFATVDKKFVQHAKLIQQLSRQVSEQNKYVQNKFKILDLRMQQSSEVLKNIAALKERVTRQMQIQNDNINNLRKNIQGMISDLNSDIRDTRKQIAQNAESSEKKDTSIEEEIRRIKQNILTIEDNINLHREMHRQKTIQLEEHERVIERHTEQIKDLFENKYLTKRLGDYVEDMDSEIKKILFKVDCMAPLITQAQISDCLIAILPPKIRNKITIYEYKKYFELNRQILDKDFKKVSNTFKGLEFLQQMQKKCTKEIIQLKRKKLMEMGIDIDHATYEEREKYYSEISLDDELNMDIEETRVAQKVDESEIRRIIQNFFSEYMASFKDQIKIQIEDNKKYIYCVEEEIKHEVTKFQNYVSSVKNQCAAFHTEQILELKLTNSHNKNIQKLIQHIEGKVQQQKNLQRLFYNFCSLINHLQIQDEIDKQNISLLGTKQSNSDNMMENKQRNSVVALDGKCFSCNGYPATTLTAFKMACLAYHPSSIKIDSKEYKRQELLEFTTNMLQGIKKFIQEGNSKIPENQPLINQSDELSQKQPSLALKMKSLTLNPYQPGQKGSFKNSFISKHLQTQVSQPHEDRMGTASKYRKKTLTSTYSSSYSKKKNSIKKSLMTEEMLKTSIIFNSLKKQNQSYLT